MAKTKKPPSSSTKSKRTTATGKKKKSGKKKQSGKNKGAKKNKDAKKNEKKIWERKNPKAHHKRLTKRQRANAKRTASKHGRSKPSLVDNINAAK
jgi:hypothetical protein